MGNCFSVSKFNEQTKNNLKPFLRKDGLYELKFTFKDLNLNPITDPFDINYSIEFIFSDYEFINTYIYKRTYFNNKFYPSRISTITNNEYLYEKIIYFYQVRMKYIFPNIECIKKINDTLLTEMYDSFFYKTN